MRTLVGKGYTLGAVIQELAFDETPTKIRLGETLPATPSQLAVQSEPTRTVSSVVASSKPSLAKVMQSDATLVFVLVHGPTNRCRTLSTRTRLDWRFLVKCLLTHTPRQSVPVGFRLGVSKQF